ncbi:hypothetical protein ColTof3_13462 [Colletotrichum tofieldiae]|nr:hypothetical protein ColTof3_13462 [Colletotrichum tofieldiae]
MQIRAEKSGGWKSKRSKNGVQDLVVVCGGSFAEYALAPLKNLVKAPGRVSYTRTAGPTDFIVTTCHVVVTEARVPVSHMVDCIGLGGLELKGFAVAALRGARLVGIHLSEAKFEQADGSLYPVPDKGKGRQLCCI